MADKFVDRFFTKEGESVEEAKARMAAAQKAMEESNKQRIQNIQKSVGESNMKTTEEIVAEARRKAGLE